MTKGTRCPAAALNSHGTPPHDSFCTRCKHTLNPTLADSDWEETMSFTNRVHAGEVHRGAVFEFGGPSEPYISPCPHDRWFLRFNIHHSITIRPKQPHGQSMDVDNENVSPSRFPAHQLVRRESSSVVAPLFPPHLPHTFVCPTQLIAGPRGRPPLLVAVVCGKRGGGERPPDSETDGVDGERASSPRRWRWWQ